MKVRRPCKLWQLGRESNPANPAWGHRCPWYHGASLSVFCRLHCRNSESFALISNLSSEGTLPWPLLSISHHLMSDKQRQWLHRLWSDILICLTEPRLIGSKTSRSMVNETIWNLCNNTCYIMILKATDSEGSLGLTCKSKTWPTSFIHRFLQLDWDYSKSLKATIIAVDCCINVWAEDKPSCLVLTTSMLDSACRIIW